MVICCVPKCGADSWKCDTNITFYDFPTNPDLSAKWIKQINTALKPKPMWFPRGGKPIICSKHFLHTDFKGDTDLLKPRCVPTVFGHRYIGPNPEIYEANKTSEKKTAPLIVKFIKPSNNVVNNDDSGIKISNICTVSNVEKGDFSNIQEQSAEINKLQGNNLQISACSSNTNDEVQILQQVHCNNFPILSDKSKSMNSPHTLENNSVSQIMNKSIDNTGSTPKTNNTTTNGLLNPISGSNNIKSNPPKKSSKRKDNSDLIEIGPNTFLKINPDIIKVNKKKTPSGNTVIQFLMDQKIAKNYAGDLLPKVVQTVNTSAQEMNHSESTNTNAVGSTTVTNGGAVSKSVQHVLGHIVDTDTIEEKQANSGNNDIVMTEPRENNEECADSPVETDSSFIEEAPVLLTTKMPLSHCFLDKEKYILQLKQKGKQVNNLKVKISQLCKKIEELEDKCIVQERQLSYSFIKRLKAIRKDAVKGDPHATFLLEQIRGYSDKSRMRWSDSTLTQCAVWCKKAPYAYEYFKKADLFKLPCLNSVKRFIKKHPDIKFTRNLLKPVQENEKDNIGGDAKADGNSSSSSSDFDFDSDFEKGLAQSEEDEQQKNDTVLSIPSETDIVSPDCNTITAQKTSSTNVNDENSGLEIDASENTLNSKNESVLEGKTTSEQEEDNLTAHAKDVESSGVPITVDSSNLELQEIVLPSGEVVQCYSSTADGGGQYYIIPNVSDQDMSGDHEFSVIQADSLPLVLQNLETSQLHVQQDQLILISNSSDQVECTETEIVSA